MGHVKSLISCETIGYLGPMGTFTEEALRYSSKIAYKQAVPFSTIEETLMAVEEGVVERAIVPIENSIEGSVNATLDTLAFDVHLFIQMELAYPIRHAILAREGTELKDITRLISHPHATAQCRKKLSQLLPGVPYTAANSTSEAARTVAESDEKIAALGNKLSSEIYGLKILAEGLEDHADNLTRFVVVGKEKMPPTGNDKTSMVCFIHQDRPGSLLQILQEFAYRYINLTKIESRPTKETLGNYCFFIDCAGHEQEEILTSALKCLNCKLREVKLLGSYPMLQEDN